MSFPSQIRNNRLKNEEKSQIKDKASLKDFSKEVSEEKEAVKQIDLQMIDPNQVTLKDGNHGQRANEHYEEEVNSLLTIKKRVSLNDPQNRVSKKEAKKKTLRQKIPKMMYQKKKMSNKQIFKKKIPKQMKLY